MVALKTAPEARSQSLLSSFGEKREELKELYKKFQEFDEEVRARKTYRKIDTAINNYLKQPVRAGPQLPNGTSTEETEVDSYPKVVLELRNILDFDPKDVDLKRVELFTEAVQDWTPSRSSKSENGSGTKDERWKSDPAYITVQALCLVDPEMAFTMIDKDANTPFEGAAKAGAAELVEVMIEELLNFLKDRYPDLTKRKEEARKMYLSRRRRNDGKTAFLLAAEKLRYAVLKQLLEDYPQLARMDSVRATIQKTAPNEKQKDQDAALEAFKLIVKHMEKVGDDAIWAEIWQEAVETASLKVVHHLLKETGQAGIARFVTYDDAKFVMKKGSKEIWSMFERRERRELVGTPDDKKDLLHIAVEYRNAEIVEEILEEFPDQIEVDIGPKNKPLYPMQFLNKTNQPGESRAIYDRIRNALLHAMIRSTSQNMGIREIRRILRDSKVEADTICLHLSNIDTEEQMFTEYVQWLQDQDETTGKIFKFESILKYANFPDLHSQEPKHSEDVAKSLRVDHTEIWTVFKWLRKCGVTQILELSVPDRLFCPHSDAHVRKCVVGWGVRVLKWRKLDLYLGNLTDKKDLQELHLYSSGNQSVHEQWYRELEGFPNLRRLYVYVVVDVLSTDRVEGVKAELQKRLDEINRTRIDQRWTKGRPGLEKEKVGDRQVGKVPIAEYHWATDTGYRTYRNLAEITNDVVGPNLAAFISKYHAATSKKKDVTRTKVALIDSGVVIVGGKAKSQAQAQATEEKELVSDEKTDHEKDSVKLPRKVKAQWSTNDLAHRVKGGKSFVNTGDDEEQVWWHASEPHGTQMARLICSIDPCCELYVIKVAETRSSGISANVVAEAIRWAIGRGVDVISLSLVAYTDTEQMSIAIKEANDRDIVILSSTADEGVMTKMSATDNSTHRNNNDVFTIAACDRWGNLLDRSQKEGYQYRFFGHNVHVGQVPFLKSSESISGSSVATAIAAGTASLILVCCRISKACNTEQDSLHFWRCRMVRDAFYKMFEGPELKYVALENLCGKGKKLKDADFQHTVDSTFQLP